MDFISQDLLSSLVVLFLILKTHLNKSSVLNIVMHVVPFSLRLSPHRRHFQVLFKSSPTRLACEKQAEEGLASSDLQTWALPAGQISGEDFVIWKCLTVRLIACGGRLLSLQGLNMILSKPDNPGKASQWVPGVGSQAPDAGPLGISF